MKTQKTIGLILGLIIALSLLSCSEENDSPPEQVQTQIKEILKSGTWKITRFEDSGKDETGHFSAYDFTFRSSNILTADNGMNQLDGNWSIMDDSSADDNLDDLDLIVHFSESSAFEELNEDWNFISYSESLVELIHVSGGNGGTDYLTLEKK